MGECTIRKAEREDVPLVLGLVKELASYERLSHEVKVTASALETAMFGERRFIEAVLAEAVGQPVGYASFYHNFSTFNGKPGMWVEDIFVLPTQRGRGYGRALFRALAKIAEERGCGRLEWSALDWNEAAITFYLEFGARKLDEWTMFRLDENGIARLARGSQEEG